MTTARDAIAMRIRTLRERKARLLEKVDAVDADIASLVAQRDGLTDVQAGKIDALQAAGVVKVED